MNDGAGYTSGTYSTGTTYSNGVPVLRGSKFTEAQTLTAEFLGDEVGYQVQLALTEPTTLREILRRFHQTFGSMDATNRLGQFYPVVINDHASQSALSNALSPLQDEATMSGNLFDESDGSALALLTDEQFAYRDRINILRWGGESTRTTACRRDSCSTAAGIPTDSGGSIENTRDLRTTPQRYGHTEAKQKAVRNAYYSHDVPTLGGCTGPVSAAAFARTPHDAVRDRPRRPRSGSGHGDPADALRRVEQRERRCGSTGAHHRARHGSGAG